MCLLVVAWRSHPRYRLILAANRDEFHDRPAAALGWWPEVPGMLGGRDLRAGGAWLGLSRSGRFGIVTNYRERDVPAAAAAPSRGGLVPAFLGGQGAPDKFLGALQPDAERFAGFNLMLGDPSTLLHFSNATPHAPRALPPGVHGLGNESIDEPTAKLKRTRQRLADEAAGADPSIDRLFDLLADPNPAPDGEYSSHGLPVDLERALSAPFVRHSHYGTRCSTVAFVEHGGRTLVHERRFDAAGTQSGASRFEFGDAAT